MWGAVTQLPGRALGLGARVWGFYLHLLSLGLRALLLCLLLLLRTLYVCVQEAGKAMFTAVGSVALAARVCGIHVLLQGVAWTAQLVGSWVALHVWLCCALLETLRRILLVLPCEQASRWLVRAGVRAGVWAGRGLARVWGMATLVQLCAHTLFLGVHLCMHVCFAAISSKVRVRVHAPFSISLPFRVHTPLSLGFRVGLQAQRHDRAEGEQGTPQVEQRPQMSRRLEPTRRREVSLTRSELRPGG